MKTFYMFKSSAYMLGYLLPICRIFPHSAHHYYFFSFKADRTLLKRTAASDSQNSCGAHCIRPSSSHLALQ